MTLCSILFTCGGGSDSIVIGLRLQVLCIVTQIYSVAIDVRRGHVVNVFRYSKWQGGLCYSIMGSSSQCLVMAYVIDTPSRRLESYIIHTPADVGRRLDSFLFHTSADGRPVR